jgi:acyl carrier protein
MDSATIIQELQPIFADILDRPDVKLSPESNGYTVDGWDSLAHINLVTAIEKQYHIKFALGELQDLRNLGEMVDLIQRKLGK